MYPLSLFPFLLFIYALLTLYFLYHIFFRGRVGPITRKAEIEEHLAKTTILDKHNLNPDERKRKHRFFGMFSYIDDEPIGGDNEE